MIGKASPARARLISLLAFVLFIGYAACKPSSATTIPGPRFNIAGVGVSAQFSQEYVNICAGNGVYLAVWQDRRSNVDYDIYGILLDSNGSPIVAESFLISKMAGGTPAPNDQWYPAVGFNGTDFLVAWSDRRAANQIPRIYAARVTTSGQVLDQGGIAFPTAPTPTEQFVPQIASNGVTWQVVWQEKNSMGNDDIYGAQVSASGVVGSRVAIAFRADNESWPSIAWNGSNYLVVWQDYRNSESTGTDIYGCRLTASGTKVGSSEIVISTAAGSSSAGAAGAQTAPSVAAGSSGTWMVVWQDARGADDDIYCARVSSAGDVVTADRGGKVVSSVTDDQEEPSIGWDGTNFVAAWRDKSSGRAIRAGRINISGTVLDPNGIVINSGSAGSYGPSIACRNGISLIGWYSLDALNADVLGTRLNSFGQVGSIAQWSLCLQNQPHFSAAFDGTNYVVTWSDRRSGLYRVYAARVSPDGTILDPEGVLVTSGSSLDQTEPAIAWNGTHYLVVWTELVTTFTDIKAMRLTPTLARVDASPITLCNLDLDQNAPAVAWNGTHFLVVWVDYRNAVAPNYYCDIRGARVSATGVVSNLSSAICNFNNNQFAPAVAACGSNFLVAWEDYRTNGAPVIYYNRVTGDGAVLDSNGIMAPAIAYYNVQPSVASDGTNYLIVWSDKRAGWSNDNIYGVRISQAGTRLDAEDIIVCSAARDQVAPSAVWNGQNYLVAWQDGRNWSTSSDDIYMNAVTSAGVVVDPADSLICGAGHSERNPSVVTCGAGLGAVFYSDFLNATYRTGGCIISEAPPVPEVTDDGIYSTLPGSLHATWTVGPRQDEVAEYRYAIGTTAGGADIVDWTSAGLLTEITHSGLALVDGNTYYISVQARTAAGMWSESGVSDGIIVDASAPTTPVVADDGDCAASNVLNATWSAEDAHTGVQEYRYAIGSSPGGTDLADWTSVGTDTSITRSDLSIADGTTCYFAVQARNGAGSWSTVGMSDGILVDTSAPTTPVVTDDGDYSTNPMTIHAAWTAEDAHTGITEYQYAIGTSAGGTDIVDWTSAGTSTEITRDDLSLTDGTTYYVAVKAKNGVEAWSAIGSSDGIEVDASAPTTPTVIDDGDYALPDFLHAVWTSEDAHSGIQEYQYAIGTTPGGTDVVDWTSAGSEGSITHTGLSLQEDVTYYISVRALNGAGLWSDVGSSDGITVPALVNTIADAKLMADDQGMRLTGKVVVAGTDSLPDLPGPAFFYIEEENRTSGIKVVSAEPISTGCVVDIAGEIETVDGERQITASVVRVSSAEGTAPDALNMMDRAIGGFALNEHTPGVYKSFGPHNVGLLVMTWGKVTYAGGADEDYCYVNGGSYLRDGSGHAGVKVYCGHLTKPAVGSTVLVTGISSCEPLADRLVRRVLATKIVEYP